MDSEDYFIDELRKDIQILILNYKKKNIPKDIQNLLLIQAIISRAGVQNALFYSIYPFKKHTWVESILEDHLEEINIYETIKYAIKYNDIKIVKMLLPEILDELNSSYTDEDGNETVSIYPLVMTAIQFNRKNIFEYLKESKEFNNMIILKKLIDMDIYNDIAASVIREVDGPDILDNYSLSRTDHTRNYIIKHPDVFMSTIESFFRQSHKSFIKKLLSQMDKKFDFLFRDRMLFPTLLVINNDYDNLNLWIKRGYPMSNIASHILNDLPNRGNYKMYDFIKSHM